MRGGLVSEGGADPWETVDTHCYRESVTQHPLLSCLSTPRVSYTKTKTKQYDEEATRYLSYVLYPLVIGYAIYSLVYKTHNSWYSWILNSLVGAVYMFGFILMCPQLYLNYRLKVRGRGGGG